jgi:hypothetical protein
MSDTTSRNVDSGSNRGLGDKMKDAANSAKESIKHTGEKLFGSSDKNKSGACVNCNKNDCQGCGTGSDSARGKTNLQSNTDVNNPRI